MKLVIPKLILLFCLQYFGLTVFSQSDDIEDDLTPRNQKEIVKNKKVSCDSALKAYSDRIRNKPLKCGSDIEFDDITKAVYKKGSQKPLNGSCMDCYDNNQLKRFVSFVDGREDGESIAYYRNGQVWQKTPHVMGKANGTWELYNEQGLMLWQINYLEDKKNGECTWYYKNDTTKKKVENYQLDKLHGKCTYYFKNGEVKKEVNYQDGVFHGKYILYRSDTNRKIVLKKTYYEGKPDGKNEVFYESGQLAYFELYEKGTKEGTWVSYHQNGKKKEEKTFKKGKKEGRWVTYYNDEKIKSEIIYKKGSKISEKHYDEYGRLKQ